MPARAGERAHETGDFRCDKCGMKVHVAKNREIPSCIRCGNDAYSERMNEPSHLKSSRSTGRRPGDRP
ncbi:alpha helical protein [Geobacter sp. DSM 9736]|uniref:zinc ribbon-containing protein n=1 Tax=Geobacter sp. DSM 9736 TaxID=1277350 RepID=UPI000B50A9D2|nr:alpha helical protein [Geobacter sp. DSM 9736]SNB46781.1 Zinc-ribbon containing domain-containing protein [Geobacter sp. DSM 9736]